jgi:2-iminobutanoate/2-iminopropanoate deaminase
LIKQRGLLWSNLSRLIKVSLFVNDLSGIESLREALLDIYQELIPASSLIQVKALFCDELKIEMETIISL